MKKMIRVPVGCEPKIAKYGYGGGEYIDYGYSQCRLDTHQSLKSLIAELTGYQKQYRDRYQDMEFEERRDCGCRHDCGCSPSYVLYGKRYETDLEYQFRLKKEAEMTARREEQERAEFERLKAKFQE
jgi:hypothetical protein